MAAVKKILVVEEKTSSARKEGDILRSRDYRVVTISDPDEIEAALVSHPDVSLLLIELNSGATKTIARESRLFSGGLTLPLVFLTSNTDPDILERLKGIPRYGFIQKGSEEVVLVSSIETAFALFKEKARNQRLLSALRKSEEKYKATFQTSPDAITISEQNGRYIEINEGFTSLTGYTREDVLGRMASDLGIWVSIEDRDLLLRRIQEEGVCRDFESMFRCKNGELKTGLISACLISFDNKAHLIVVVRDISERKKAERRAAALLEEKELLLREVHHRVKNNMASIASLLSLQASSAKSEEVGIALREMEGRIRSIQMVYEKLFHSTDFKSFSFGEYLEDMLEIFRSSLPRESGIALESRLADIPLEANRIFPLGLIANELVTNALKHAFPDGRAGVIRVVLDRTEPERCELTVSDDGKGLPEDLQPETSSGFGLTLVTALTAQLGGTISFRRDGGTSVKISFPAPPAAALRDTAGSREA